MDTPAQPTSNTPAATYGVELLFQNRPLLDRAAILAHMRAYCGEVVTPHEGEAALQFFFPGHPVKFSNGELPAQLVLLQTEQSFSPAEAQADLQQSWQWPEAGEWVRQCRHSLVFTDLMSSLLPYRERLELFCAGLRAVLTTVNSQALHWRPAGQFVDPQRFLAGHGEELIGERLHGAVNVRFYNIADTGERLMDSLGLAPLGLPDVQCHYRNLEPSAVARTLYNTAYYIYDQGDVVADGHTVQGLALSEKWTCQHEESLVEPRRRVLNLNPGPHFAAK